ncbi:sensory box histidine kinase [Thermogutta terrifontis]|uniref:histidine kinase n=1 Tax=Thermogutta terrifontis TaxID=1331910 RepID=A0A286RJZ6_9BACT|nr:ATP-binding protein [Thermogutta terrifontis]ASV76277.1 sensory box histidine kinase [Thermogutta terrifontis]
MPSLFVIRGNDQGTRFELEGSVITIGRDSSNKVQLHDAGVSRHHAEIRRVENRYRLIDLNSSNGTIVNGKRIQEHWLNSGDQIQMGRTLMLFTSPAEESEREATWNVSIAAEPEAERSQIVSVVSSEEGNRLLRGQGVAPDSWLAQARRNLEIVYHTALAASHTLDIEQLLNRIMDLIFEWVEADRGCIMLVDPDTGKLVPKVRRVRKGVVAPEKLIISQTILDYVRERNEGVLTSDARHDERWDSGASIVQAGIREAICVPMQGRYGVVGVIYIDTSTSPQEMIRRGQVNKFTQDHLMLMIAIGHQAALAVEDTHYYLAMVQAERLAAIGQTIATLSHHIKNILQGIRGGGYLIELGLKQHDEELIRKGWAIVEKNQAKISGLVMDMLTFSKEREPDLQPSDLNQLIQDIVELMQARAEESQIDFTWERQSEIPTLVFDPEGIHRAVLNLVTNAFDAVADSPEPRRVRVFTRYDADQGKVWIGVEDNGPGIPPEMLDKIFSPFVSFKKGSRGTGLGLPVSQKIVQEHGGRITVESAPGQGTRFTIELPAMLPSEATSSVTATQERSVLGPFPPGEKPA